jgi:hypothetical protein
MLRWAFGLMAGLVLTTFTAQANDVPIRALGRFDGWRENALVGYGLGWAQLWRMRTSAAAMWRSSS